MGMPNVELIYRFKDDMMIPISTREFSGAEQTYYHRSYLMETRNGTFLYRQFNMLTEWTEINVQISKEELIKQPLDIPLFEEVVMDQDILGVDA